MYVCMYVWACWKSWERTTHFVAHEAVEDEDKESLKTVEDGEDVSHEERLRVNVEQTKQPRQTKQYDQYTRTLQPRTTQQNTRS